MGSAVGVCDAEDLVVVDEGHLEIHLGQAPGKVITDHAAEFDLAQAQVLVRVALHLAVPAGGGVHDLLEALEADGVEQALGEHGYAVLPAQAAAFEDGAQENVAQVLQRQRVCRKLLGYDRQRGGGGLADAQGQVAGRPAHADNDVPA